MFYDFPQTRTEKSLIQLKLKVTTRKRRGNYISFLNAALHHIILKVSMCTIKCSWRMANPSKPNFHDWRDPSEGWYRLLCTDTGECGGTTARGARPWRCRKLIFFPVPCAIGPLPANTQHCSVPSARLAMWHHFYGISPLLQNITCPRV